MFGSMFLEYHSRASGSKASPDRVHIDCPFRSTGARGSVIAPSSNFRIADFVRSGSNISPAADEVTRPRRARCHLDIGSSLSSSSAMACSQGRSLKYFALAASGSPEAWNISAAAAAAVVTVSPTFGATSGAGALRRELVAFPECWNGANKVSGRSSIEKACSWRRACGSTASWLHLAGTRFLISASAGDSWLSLE